MSVDELEAKLGMDFCVNLPAKVGEAAAAKLEATDPANVALWWYFSTTLEMTEKYEKNISNTCGFGAFLHWS